MDECSKTRWLVKWPFSDELLSPVPLSYAHSLFHVHFVLLRIQRRLHNIQSVAHISKWISMSTKKKNRFLRIIPLNSADNSLGWVWLFFFFLSHRHAHTNRLIKISLLKSKISSRMSQFLIIVDAHLSLRSIRVCSDGASSSNSALFVYRTDVINSICLSLGPQFHFDSYRCRTADSSTSSVQTYISNKKDTTRSSPQIQHLNMHISFVFVYFRFKLKWICAKKWKRVKNKKWNTPFFTCKQNVFGYRSSQSLLLLFKRVSREMSGGCEAMNQLYESKFRRSSLHSSWWITQNSQIPFDSTLFA